MTGTSASVSAFPITKLLGDILGHRIRVRSRPGKGSVFVIEVELFLDGAGSRPNPTPTFPGATGRRAPASDSQFILVIEDHADVRQFVELLLENEGHHVTSVGDGIAALELVARGTLRPDLIITDYNLPDGMNGLEVAASFGKSFMPGFRSSS